MDLKGPHCTPGLRMYQTLMEKNRTLRLLNQDRLRELRRDEGDAVQIFFAHDVREFERMAMQSHRTPASEKSPGPRSDRAPATVHELHRPRP